MLVVRARAIVRHLYTNLPACHQCGSSQLALVQRLTAQVLFHDSSFSSQYNTILRKLLENGRARFSSLFSSQFSRILLLIRESALEGLWKWSGWPSACKLRGQNFPFRLSLQQDLVRPNPAWRHRQLYFYLWAFKYSSVDRRVATRSRHFTSNTALFLPEDGVLGYLS